jgi:tRNA(Ile)-lysidine synthetase-like protein
MGPELVDRAVLKVLACVREALLRCGLSDPQKGILCAVSGGVDSVVLLHALCRLRQETGFFVGVAHLNHCLRGAEADKDADFVKSLCSSLDLRLHLERADVLKIARSRGLGIEEAGRNIRYAFLERVRAAYGYTGIALGHQGDDNAETVLLNLLRGAGPQGLSGMDEQSGQIFRPLLSLYRRDILAFAKALSLEFVEDSSNQDSGFALPTQQESFYMSVLSPILGNLFQAVGVVLNMVLTIFMWIIIIRAVLSWVSPDPYNPIVRFINQVTDPVLYRVRRIFPLVYGGFDLSPILVILAIYFLKVFVVGSLFAVAAHMNATAIIM